MILALCLWGLCILAAFGLGFAIGYFVHPRGNSR